MRNGKNFDKFYPSPSKLSFKTTFLSCLLLIAASTNTYATPIPEFEAEFKVKIFYFTVGTAYQSMTCESETCTLKNQASPPKWARKYINEAVKESITLINSDNQFIWQSYHKHLTRTYSDKPTREIFTDLQVENNRVVHAQSNNHWPANHFSFDMISLAYAIQHAVLNQKSLKKFVLQDDEGQEPLKLKDAFEEDELDLPIESDIETELFEFRNGKINAEIWLAPKWQYFPVQIKLEDKRKDRTITLELSKLKLKKTQL